MKIRFRGRNVHNNTGERVAVRKRISSMTLEELMQPALPSQNREESLQEAFDRIQYEEEARLDQKPLQDSNPFLPGYVLVARVLTRFHDEEAGADRSMSTNLLNAVRTLSASKGQLHQYLLDSGYTAQRLDAMIKGD